MPVTTRAMDDKFEQLMAMMMAQMKEEFKTMKEEMKKDMRDGQEEIKKDMENGQQKFEEKLETSQQKFEEKLEAGQKKSEEEFKTVMEKMQNFEGGQEKLKEEIKAELANNRQLLDEFKEELKSEQAKFKVEIQEEVDEKIQEVRNEVKDQMQVVREEVKDRMQEIVDCHQEFERRFKALEKRQVTSPSIEPPSRPSVKLSTFDGQTPWRVFKVQFDVVADANGWDNATRASQLIASLRGPAAEVLQNVPTEKLQDPSAIEAALECRYGDAHLTEYYRAELKARRQKTNESLQELATDIERLVHLAFSDCSLQTQGSLAAQYFTDALRDEEMQQALRLSESKDLRSALVFAMKYESAKSVSKTSRHLRTAVVEDEKNDHEGLRKKIEELVDLIKAEHAPQREASIRRRNWNNTCWSCNRKGHLQMDCPRRNKKEVKSSQGN